VSVEELLTEPGMLLLVRGPGGIDDLRAALGDLGTVVPVAHEGAGDALGWVRPDGYLGLVADSTDPDVLRRYLAGALHLTQPVAA